MIYYEKQLSKIQSLYNISLKALNEEKENSFNKLIKQKEEILNKYQKWETLSEEYDSELWHIKNDIGLNVDNIANSIQMDSFRFIMNNYLG